jgi:hypothetical protein
MDRAVAIAALVPPGRDEGAKKGRARLPARPGKGRALNRFFSAGPPIVASWLRVTSHDDAGCDSENARCHPAFGGDVSQRRRAIDYLCSCLLAARLPRVS